MCVCVGIDIPLWIDMEALKSKKHTSLLCLFDSLGAIRQISSLESAASRVVMCSVRGVDMRSVRDFSASMSTHSAIGRILFYPILETDSEKTRERKLVVYPEPCFFAEFKLTIQF